MNKKRFIKRISAAAISLALSAGAIIPHVYFNKIDASGASYFPSGACIDKTGYSDQHAYHGLGTTEHPIDVYQSATLMPKGKFGSNIYNKGLNSNITCIRNVVGNNDLDALRLFWAVVICLVTDTEVKYQEESIEAARYWYNYAQKMYKWAQDNNYAKYISDNPKFHQITQSELGKLLHVTNEATGQTGWDDLANRDPLYKALTESLDHFFSNSHSYPQAMPWLGKNWASPDSKFEPLQTDQTGSKSSWPVDSSTHFVQTEMDAAPSRSDVENAALKMDENDNYKVENEVNHYKIPMYKSFWDSVQMLAVWNEQTGSWEQKPMKDGAEYNVNSWNISFHAKSTGYYAEFIYKGELSNGKKPRELLMYFPIPSNSAVAFSGEGYNSPIEFVARYLHIEVCKECNAAEGKKTDPALHQRLVSLYAPAPIMSTYPCFKITGQPITNPVNPEPGTPEEPVNPVPEIPEIPVPEIPEIPVPEIPEIPEPDNPVIPAEEITMDFQIYSHAEEWTSDYNVQLQKSDYETGSPISGTQFTLYERFDDKEQLNMDKDGAVQLYGGNDHGAGATWQSGYEITPVVWDNFRKVGYAVTSGNGTVQKNLKKVYHYEKTFCDGHPVPAFVSVPVAESESQATNYAEEIQSYRNENMKAAQTWLALYDACEKMAKDERPGVQKRGDVCARGLALKGRDIFTRQLPEREAFEL